MKINRYYDFYLVKMDTISELRILSSYNELLAIWTSVVYIPKCIVVTYGYSRKVDFLLYMNLHIDTFWVAVVMK